MFNVTLTLEQMYEMQKELDAKIIREKGLEGQDLLPNTVLALQVEICELANEWRGFKHWSNDREPRYEKKTIAFANPGGPFEHVTYPLLEEYVDCLHFFLSIAQQLNLEAEDLYLPDDVLENQTNLVFTELLNNVGLINAKYFLINPHEAGDQVRCFQQALYIFYLLGEQRLGFTFNQIAEAYAAKNAVNHERQVNGY
ncbi:MAG: dUTP diphosphatase [Paenibacillaceae bacterium]|nr:dUTP diphosphatase [Paenibacillaceae bacterium]